MYRTFKQMIDEAVSEEGHRTAYQWFDEEELCSKTYGEFKEDMLHFLEYLEEGLPERRHMGVVGYNSYEWVASYLGVMYSKHVIVPVDKELPPKSLVDIINMGNLDTLVVTGGYKDAIIGVKEHLQVRRIIYVSLKGEVLNISGEIIHEEIHHDLGESPLEAKKIIFTSGTTGVSKGVMLREAGILDNLHAFNLIYKNADYQVLYNLLPMHHMYAVIGDILHTIHSKGTLCINLNPRKIVAEIRYFKPYGLHIVPLIAESFIRMAGLAIKNNQLNRVIDFFGGELHYIFCSGAFVPEKLIEQYENAGISVLRGYGLTEASAGVASTGSDDESRLHDFSTVGKPLICNEVRIKEGEIQVRGSNVMIGYYKNPKATQEAFDGEWLKTGDLGYMEGNNLYITGRSKNVIILSNGKNIYPEEIEEYFSGLPGVDELFVFEGHLTSGNQVLAAAVYTEKGDEEEILKAIEAINLTLPSYKQLNKIIFTSCPFIKTTTRKIKRESSKKKVIYENTFNKVKELLGQVLYMEEIKENSNLILDLRLNSFSTYDFISRCEDCFHITIEIEDMKPLKTVGDIVRFITTKTNFQIA